MKVKRAKLTDIYELFGTNTGNLILNEKQQHYICWEGDEPLGYTAIREFRGYYKSQANFVREEYRRRGIFTFMLWCMMDQYTDKPIKADCLKTSIGVYLRLGFHVVGLKQYQGGYMYCVEWEKANEKDVRNC